MPNGDPKLDSGTQENGRESPEVFHVTDKDSIEVLKRDLHEELGDLAGIDLSKIEVNFLKPGDDSFDTFEIQEKFLKERCDDNFDKYISILKKHGIDTDKVVPFEKLRRVAEEENIKLDGWFPSVASVQDGEGVINFFAVKEDRVIDMARIFAEKNRDEIEFQNIDKAKEYLRSYAKYIFVHEVGHVVYDKVKAGDDNWLKLIEKYPEIIQRVIEVQRAKYTNEEEIPIADESFADIFVPCVTDMKSRIGTNIELEDEVLRMINKVR